MGFEAQYRIATGIVAETLRARGGVATQVAFVKERLHEANQLLTLSPRDGRRAA